MIIGAGNIIVFKKGIYFKGTFGGGSYIGGKTIYIEGKLGKIENSYVGLLLVCGWFSLVVTTLVCWCDQGVGLLCFTATIYVLG